ncbi:hypothetical protein Tco_0864551 [Tanacetum coccineum]
MTKQERASMLYDEFDKFTSDPEESIHSYYLRFAKLISDMNMIPMSMSNMQINTKFVNHLQPEWSRFVTAAKQARDLYAVNFDQLYAFLKHNEKDAIEVREMQKRFPNPLGLLANTYNLPPSYNITQQLIHSPPKQSYVPPVVPQQPPMLPTQPDFEFVITTFLPTDDPIESLNKAMLFFNFLADRLEENDDGDDLHLHTTSNFKVDNVDAYDSDLTPTFDSNTLSKVPHYDTYHDDDMLNFDVQETEYNEHVVSHDDSYVELTSNSNVISYAEYMVTIQDETDHYAPPPVQNKDMLLSAIDQMKSQVDHCNKVN